ncbi:hypothetical protein HanIR_Chr11g0545181 [Helianthus annuus]|nr:hypothetical protein HanIR_Chr11g0545181 [Helianthus annuus]
MNFLSLSTPPFSLFSLSSLSNTTNTTSSPLLTTGTTTFSAVNTAFSVGT